MNLRLDWCSYEAARFAVKHWHYSRTMPSGKAVKIGVWEAGQFIGCVLFSRGANANLGSPYGLTQTEICELTRVALTNHTAPVSRIAAIATRMLRKQSPGLRLLISFADPDHGHHGGIYQALGWLYTGLSVQTGGFEYQVGGKWVHTRSLALKTGSRSDPVLQQLYPHAEKRRQPRKHRYLYPLDPAMRAQVAPLARPYPKRAGSVASDMPADHVGGDGATPIPALQLTEGIGPIARVSDG